MDEAKSALSEARRLNPSLTIKWFREHAEDIFRHGPKACVRHCFNEPAAASFKHVNPAGVAVSPVRDYGLVPCLAAEAFCGGAMVLKRAFWSSLSEA